MIPCDYTAFFVFHASSFILDEEERLYYFVIFIFQNLNVKSL